MVGLKSTSLLSDFYLFHLFFVYSPSFSPDQRLSVTDGLFFPRGGRFPRGLSPTGRSPGRRDDAAPGPGLAPSATLVSLSSVSDCNSTRSLLRSDSDEAAPAAPSPPPSPPPPQPSTNPLVDLELESFKKDPRQSLTPTHVTAARAVSRGHRRTPSDGALGQRGAPEPMGPGPGE